MALSANRDSYGLIHSDLHQWNMIYDGRELWPIDFDNLHYDWFISDFTTIIINAVICQSRSSQLRKYGHWTGGRRMDSVEFLDHFMEPLMIGYRQMNRLDPVWMRSVPRFLSRHYFTFYVDSLWDPEFRSLSEKQQAAEFPWRILSQMEDEIRSDYWGTFDFSKFA